MDVTIFGFYENNRLTRLDVFQQGILQCLVGKPLLANNGIELRWQDAHNKWYIVHQACQFGAGTQKKL